MRKLLVATLVVLSSLCLSINAMAETKEIRVLLANHPYGDLLKSAIPEFESATGIKVNAESLQEGQLTTKLTTEFATKSSSVDVFMTRPLQEGKMFYKNGWYEPLTGFDFSDYPKNVFPVIENLPFGYQWNKVGFWAEGSNAHDVLGVVGKVKSGERFVPSVFVEHLPFLKRAGHEDID